MILGQEWTAVLMLPLMVLLGAIGLLIGASKNFGKPVLEETIDLPSEGDVSRIMAEIPAMLQRVGFNVRTAGARQIRATRPSPTSLAKFALQIDVRDRHIHMKTESSPNGLFFGLLPLTGCGMLCGLSCGVGCMMACSCGASGVVIGQSAVGIRSYSKHVFQLIGEVVREKGKQKNLCPSCQTPLPASARYCRNCGRARS